MNKTINCSNSMMLYAAIEYCEKENIAYNSSNQIGFEMIFNNQEDQKKVGDYLGVEITR